MLKNWRMKPVKLRDVTILFVAGTLGNGAIEVYFHPHWTRRRS